MFGKVSVVAAMFFCVSIAPAFAQMGCSDPIAPSALDGSKATVQQMKDAKADVLNFMKSSDDYQSCLLNQVKIAKQKAAKDTSHDPKPFDPAIEASATAKVYANQRLKEKVGGEFNSAVHSYQAVHPGG